MEGDSSKRTDSSILSDRNKAFKRLDKDAVRSKPEHLVKPKSDRQVAAA